MADPNDPELRNLIERRMSRAAFLRAAGGMAAGVSVVGLSACGGGGTETTGAESGSPKKGGIVQASFSDSSTKENLDPALTTLNNDSFYTGQIYEGLTIADTDWNVHPVLAEKWTPNSDATEWTFNLRQGAKFHDGSPVSSRDIAYTLQRLVNENVGSPLFSRLQPSLDKDGISAPDESTVVLKLKRPDSLIPLALSARHAMIVKDGTTDFAKTANGTGPFKLKSFSPGQSWEVVRNPAYWESGVPYLDGIRGVVVGEQSTKVQAVTSGQSDLADPIDYSAASTVQGSSAASLLEFKGSTYLNVAMDQTQEPFTNAKLVQAIKMAVDREKVLQAVFQGYGDVTHDVPVPPTDPFYPTDLGSDEPDIEGAKQLLADAGYTNGIDLELFTAASYGGQVDLAVAFSQVVEPAGIRVKIKQWSPDTYWDQVWLVKPMYVSYYTRRHPNEILAVTYASNAPWNECKLKDPELDDLLSQGLKTTDEAEQKDIYGQALTLVAEKHGIAIPAFVSKLWVKKNRLQGEELELSRGVIMKKAYLA